MTDRIYIVADSATNTETFVEASSQSEAVRVVIGERYMAKAATTTDMLRAMQSGAEIITRDKQREAGAP